MCPSFVIWGLLVLRSDFNFDLPRDLIALYPSQERTGCRLLCLNGETGELCDRAFTDLVGLLSPGDLLVFNDTRVIPARLLGRKDTGGAVEVLVERLLGTDAALVHARASKAPKAGGRILLGDGKALEVTGREGDLFSVRLEGGGDLLSLLEWQGHVPLPPYIDRPDEALDRERYQTVYSKVPGAVAAPTAGLHFDEALLGQLASAGVEMAYATLHVGAGTFQPVREDEVERHHMHEEWFSLGEEACLKVREAKRRGKRVVAVGTTAVRALESAAREDGSIAPYTGNTSIFIYPGVRYKVVDALITNFHL
ncbi:MAG: tRNA preQ1(34) S-adenosylmethionine ribosyltransferase-isomerase QueA, partial [Succinivibrionaceae bacterium]|nr:tRNA preQ1(34) S-adenosylmethionine ribosyltransferase-isomerase QueA [Succinivibrionaceae bacterium]